MTTGYLILARAVHFGTCLLFFGFFAFDRFVAASIFNTHKIEAADYWKSRLRLFSIVLLPLILLSGLAWFVLVAMVMSGQLTTPPLAAAMPAISTRVAAYSSKSFVSETATSSHASSASRASSRSIHQARG